MYFYAVLQNFISHCLILMIHYFRHYGIKFASSSSAIVFLSRDCTATTLIGCVFSNIGDCKIQLPFDVHLLL